MHHTKAQRLWQSLAFHGGTTSSSLGNSSLQPSTRTRRMKHSMKIRARSGSQPRVSAEGVGVWTAQEHARFLEALHMYPHGPWKLVAAYIGTRSTRQAMTHAQKYRQKLARRQRGLRTARRGRAGDTKTQADPQTPTATKSPRNRTISPKMSASSPTDSAKPLQFTVATRFSFGDLLAQTSVALSTQVQSYISGDEEVNRGTENSVCATVAGPESSSASGSFTATPDCGELLWLDECLDFIINHFDEDALTVSTGQQDASASVTHERAFR